MQTITYHYCTCFTHKHTAICTQLYKMIALAVHTNTQLYAQNYIKFLHLLYTQTHSYMHTIT